MKAHKNLSRTQVLRYGPQKIAAMAASEFYRAAQRAGQLESARLCLMRGQELMGILETQVLPSKMALRLRPIFQRASARELLVDQKPERLSRIVSEIAFELEQVAA